MNSKILVVAILLVLQCAVYQAVERHCGEWNPKEVLDTGLVINGTRAHRGQWPWLAAIFKRPRKRAEVRKGDFFCGGSLVTKRHVITAAHCIHPKNEELKSEEDIRVGLGIYNLDKTEDVGAQVYEVRKIYLHEDWSGDHDTTFDADVAVLVLDSIVQFHNFIRTICLPWPSSINAVRTASQGLVVGWGTTETGQISSAAPFMVRTPIVTKQQCEVAFPKKLTNRMVCLKKKRKT